MKASLTKLFKGVHCALLLGAPLLLAGCGSAQYAAEDPVNPIKPFVFPGQTPALETVQAQAGYAQAPLTSPPVAVNPDRMTNRTSTLQPGDLIRISFSDIPQPPLPVEMRIPEDGKVTLMYNVTVMAAGKTISQLQEDIRKEYVPKYFVRLTPNVKTDERFYYVGGEVRVPNKQLYMGEMTVLRAVDTAGGFTDFAKRTKVELRRANGEIHIINADKARKNSKLDLKVYPNDQITVPRRFL
jgi:protein involved in polysaccharide export with SLBB domain